MSAKMVDKRGAFLQPGRKVKLDDGTVWPPKEAIIKKLLPKGRIEVLGDQLEIWIAKDVTVVLPSWEPPAVKVPRQVEPSEPPTDSELEQNLRIKQKSKRYYRSAREAYLDGSK